MRVYKKHMVDYKNKYRTYKETNAALTSLSAVVIVSAKNEIKPFSQDEPMLIQARISHAPEATKVSTPQ